MSKANHRPKRAAGRFFIIAGRIDLNHRLVIVACRKGKLRGRDAKRAGDGLLRRRENRLFNGSRALYTIAETIFSPGSRGSCRQTFCP